MSRIRMKPSTRAVLDELRQGAVTTHDFLARDFGNRFGARIKELRDLGFRIHTETGKSGAVYRLEHDAERAATAAEQARGRSPSAPTLPELQTGPPAAAAQPATPPTAAGLQHPQAEPLFETDSRRPGFMDYDEEDQAA